MVIIVDGGRLICQRPVGELRSAAMSLEEAFLSLTSHKELVG